MNNVDICLSEVLDCGKGEIDINGTCYYIDVQNTQQQNPKYNTFVSLNTTNASGSKNKGQHINTGNTKNTNYANYDNITSLQCISKCNNDPDCSAVQFNYNDKTDETDEINANGYCQIYNLEDDKSSLKDGNTILSWNEGNTIPSTGYTCANTYNKIFRSSNESNNFQIKNTDKNTILQFETTNKNFKNTPKIIKLLSKYQGGLCRNGVETDSDDLKKGYMSQWCGNNKDMNVCENFCQNNECPSKSFSSMIVFGILMFVSIFLVVIAFKNKKLTIYKVLSIISTVTFIFLLVMSIIDYTKKNYPGTKQDYIPSFESGNTCEVETCSDLFSSCYNPGK